MNFTNPEAFLQHGILGGFVLVLLFSIAATFRLITRLIDTLQQNSKDQVTALHNVEHVVRESMGKADVRHADMMTTFIENAKVLLETRESVKMWAERCQDRGTWFSPNGNGATTHETEENY